MGLDKSKGKLEQKRGSEKRSWVEGGKTEKIQSMSCIVWYVRNKSK